MNIKTDVVYVSTRGGYLQHNSSSAILSGIAHDGGLYVPYPLPVNVVNPTILGDMSYSEIALDIMAHYLPDYRGDVLKAIIENAYKLSFDTPMIAPLVKTNEVFYLELFHGPTLAFKDMALTVLPHLLKKAVEMNANNREIVILTATSGDTGKAALAGFADVEGTTIVVFFPEHGVSQIQKRQMITQSGNNTYVVGIDGNFDDAQAGVKAIFHDREITEKMAEKNLYFSSANSINVGRLIPQIVYYFFAYVQLLLSGEIKPGEVVNYVVPTGNFGNILAAYYAKKAGLPVSRLICASNQNRVLYDFFSTGVYDKNRDFFMSMSPSMDILVSSNLERLLYHAGGEDPELVRSLMLEFGRQGSFKIPLSLKEQLNMYYAGFATEKETADSIKTVYQESGYLIDPHTAVGHAVYAQYRKKTMDTTKTVIVATASPYKFTSSVINSLGHPQGTDDFQLITALNQLTGIPIPPQIATLSIEPVRHRRVCRKDEMKQQVMEILRITP